ncbi:MAG: aldehyde ferredoxin oxidoreductase family protein [Bacillota bacterium]
MIAYTGKYAVVDLSDGSIQVRDTPFEWVRKYYGGKGLVFRYLAGELPPSVDPLGPDNQLVLAASPLTGTIAPCSGKLTVGSKSPATGTILDCSVGGGFAAQLKYAGYDFLAVRGKAPHPVYLFIDDGDITVRPASDLWGKGTRETDSALRSELGLDISVIGIGPGGENMVRFACLTADVYRQAGRGGAGAVAGSKNLKAVAVRGSRAVRVPHGRKFLDRIREIVWEAVLGPDNDWAISDGTPVLVDLCHTIGVLPTRNFQEGTFEDHEKINTDRVKAHLKQRRACFGCPLACGSYVDVGGWRVEGPEYETLAMGGSNCGISDFGAIVRFNKMCDDLGLDTISTGNVLGFAMESTERGVRDYGLRFGDTQAYLKAVEDIALRRGVGELLGQGVRYLGENFGGYDFAMHVKGLEMPAYDPRGSWAMALAYATADRGADHLRAWAIAQEAMAGMDPFTGEGKPELVADLQWKNAAKWSVGVCDSCSMSPEILAELLSLATGWSLTGATDIVRAGKRIWLLGRLFNVREGFRRREDTLPVRVFEHPVRGGPADGVVVPRATFEEMLDRYYVLMGWDREGVPTREAIEECALESEVVVAFRKLP